MGFLLSLFGLGGGQKLPLFIAVIVLVAASGSIVWLKLELGKQRVLNAELNTSMARVKNERDLAIDAARVTQETLQRVKDDLEASKQAAEQLNELRKKDAKQIDLLKSTIMAQKNDPLNQVKLSPVLQTTVQTIQDNRKQRVAESSGATK